jgi:hypothetical protein
MCPSYMVAILESRLVIHACLVVAILESRLVISMCGFDFVEGMLGYKE